MKLLLKGGTVVSAAGSKIADLLIKDEKIVRVGQDLTDAEATVVPMEGKLLFPGFIDAHTHFDLDVCNTTTADNFDTGTRSALRGGTTMVVDFACPNKGETLQYGLDLWHKKADGRSSCDYSFHMTIDDWNETIKSEIPKMFEQGVSSFKMYMTYPAMMIGDKDLFYALEELKKYGGIAGVHCENAGVIDALIEQHKAAGDVAPSAHPRCRPNPLEAEAVAHLLRIAEVADVPVVIVHLSTKESLSEVAAARARGQKVYVETCPHYLLLDDSRYDQPDYSDSARFVCAPPLRKQADQEALWAALADGKGDFTKIPGGLPGVETRGILLYSEGVAKGRIPAEKMAEVLAENPAKLYGAFPRKGILAAGSDADIVVIDPTKTGLITASDQIANVDYTPFEGFRTQGVIEQVYLRGQLAVDHGEVQTGKIGQFIPRGAPDKGRQGLSRLQHRKRGLWTQQLRRAHCVLHGHRRRRDGIRVHRRRRRQERRRHRHLPALRRLPPGHAGILRARFYDLHGPRRRQL